MVVGGGFEPPKAAPSDLQSDPFDHSGTPPFMDCSFGAGTPNRTEDHLITSETLCQLSYAGPFEDCRRQERDSSTQMALFYQFRLFRIKAKYSSIENLKLEKAPKISRKLFFMFFQLSNRPTTALTPGVYHIFPGFTLKKSIPKTSFVVLFLNCNDLASSQDLPKTLTHKPQPCNSLTSRS